MKNLPCAKEEEVVQEQIAEPVIEEPLKQAEVASEAETSSMVEESEVGSGSCVVNCSEGDDSVKEFDGASILDEPMIQKATELFEATKIVVQSKI